LDINIKQKAYIKCPATGTVTLTLEQPVTTGNLILIVASGGNAAPVITDSLSNTYQRVGGDDWQIPGFGMDTVLVCTRARGGPDTLTICASGALVKIRELNMPEISPNDPDTVVSLLERLVIASRG
jgi:hypothetical protein